MANKKRLLFLIILLLATITVLAQDDSPAYLNPDLSPQERVDDLLPRMTLEEKIGQMTLIERGSIQPLAVSQNFIGGVLSGGGGYPPGNNHVIGWAQMVDSYQEAALSTRLGIPMIYGVDAVHGHGNLWDAVIFPHNIGLGATRNPELVKEIGRITALEMIATGIYWNYAPVLAVPQDVRWGRTYEGYAENTELVSQLGVAYMQGLQGDDLSAPDSVLATIKHFVGDGGTTFGTAILQDALIDRGTTDVDEETLRRIHLAPYQAAIEAGAQSLMVSYSAWGGMRMHAQAHLIQDVLRDEFGFDGFIVSDWAGIDDIDKDYYTAVVAGINAGIDMNMVPYDYKKFFNAMAKAVGNGDIPIERLDEAVGNILRVKFEMGLFEHPFSDENLPVKVGSDEHRAVARQAVSESLVLLKNENEALPLKTGESQVVFVGGEHADNIGYQLGGWSIEWQGASGNITTGTSILDALQSAFTKTADMHFNRFGRFENVTDKNEEPVIADLGIAVVGERPYAEFFGDSRTVSLIHGDLVTIQRLRERSKKLIVIVVSGRPVDLTDVLPYADAVVAAWLPGTEGEGISDVLFGDKPFTGKLSYTWQRNVEQLPFDFDNMPSEGCEAPLFPYGYGLTYDNNQSEWLDLAEECSPVEYSPASPETISSESPAEVVAINYQYKSSLRADGMLDDFEGGIWLGADANSVALGFVAWGDVPENTTLSVRQIVPYSKIALPERETIANNVLAVAYDIGGWGGFTHAFTDGENWISQDWTKYNALSFWLYGNSTGEAIQVEIFDNRNLDVIGDTAERWFYRVPDDFTGWKHFSIPFELFQRRTDFQPNGALNDGLGLDQVSGYAFGMPVGVGSQITYIDEIQLVNVDNTAEVTVAEAVKEPEFIIDESITWDSREWDLIWSDEFDSSANEPINSESWTCKIGGMGWGNNEREYYTTNIENVSHDGNGNLVITARREETDGRCWYGTCQYTSARCITEDKVEFTYGRVEARIKIPRGQGIWPAFWMLGSDLRTAGWPNSGEIDILENIGKEPNTVYGTIHGPGYSGGNGIGGGFTADAEFADDFHIYAIDWDENVIRWYLDGNLFFTVSINDVGGRDWVYDHDFFLLLNVAVGGNWPGDPDDTTVFPQEMLVDYVRVYQLKAQ